MEQQTRLGLIFLGITSIIAIIGLVLMFAGKGTTHYGIGTIYPQSGQQSGIATQTPLPPLRYGANIQYPLPTAPPELLGRQTPIVVAHLYDYGNINEFSICKNDMSTKLGPDVDEMFSQYAIPSITVQEEATGHYWPTSSAEGKPPYQFGGPILMFLNTPYERAEVTERLSRLVDGKRWTKAKMNGQTVLLCNLDRQFVFPQGIRVIPRWG